MYAWDDDFSDWRKPGAYRYDDSTADRRRADGARSRASGPRTYGRRSKPDWQLLDPSNHVSTSSSVPLVIGVDVTASMASWPAEIFDRLPLLYNTLSQYRPDLALAFAAIGDVRAFRWPLQASAFGQGFELEQVLKGIYPEGRDRGSIDNPESYGMFARWMNTRVSAPQAPGSGPDKPFCIVFGDITMHAQHSKEDCARILGPDGAQGVDSIQEFRKLAGRWDTWFLRTARCWEPDATDAQWAEAIGADHILVIEDDLRAVDMAMALVARRWGRLDDFRQNMAARQDSATVDRVLGSLPG